MKATTIRKNRVPLMGDAEKRGAFGRSFPVLRSTCVETPYF